MKKVTKVKKNWFKVQFEKHPYIYSALIGWPILIYIFGEFIDPLVGGYFEDVLAIIILSFPIIIFFLWFRKNKSKIKPFYKRNKKIFNRVYFYLGSVFSLIPIACIVGIIATGGVSNFIERVKYETVSLYFSFEGGHYCQSPNNFWSGGLPTDFIKFHYKRETQFTNYYKDEFAAFKNDNSFTMDHCYATRFVLREAHEGNEKAKEVLVAYPPDLRIIYQFPPDIWGEEMDNYIFSNYEKNIANMDLDNPAVAYSYAVYLDKNLDQYWYNHDDVKFHIKPDALKYLKQSAEDGYFVAMEQLSTIYSTDFNFDISNCDKIIEYTNALAEEKSLWNYYSLMWGYMGKFLDYNHKSKAIYNCSNQKTNFSKAFSMLIDRPTKGASDYQLKKSADMNSSYPAIFYLYGLGDVEQDYDKAYELFSYSEDKINYTYGIPDQAYMAYMIYMGMGVEQNQNKGKGLTIELAKKIDIKKLQKDSLNIELLCGGNSYNFLIPELIIPDPDYRNLSKSERRKKQDKYLEDLKLVSNNELIIKEYRDKIGQCLLESNHEVSIKFLEDYIYNRMSYWFKNPELVKKLNYLGKPN